MNAVNGVASFSGLSINNGGTGYTLSATATGFTAATSAAFNIGSALPATRLAFSVAPSSTTARDPLSPTVQVEIQNANGETISSARDAVTLSFAANPGSGTLAGTKTVNAINGIASFSGLWVNRAATGYTLSATSGSLTAATSAAFNISAGTPARLRFIAQPVNGRGNVAQPSAVTVGIVDAYDNTVTSATSMVTLAIGTNPWKSIINGLGGALAATELSVAAVAGVATFADVRIDKPATGHTCAISTESSTYCWGNNGSGQLGGTTILSNDSIPVLVQGGLTFTSVSAGGNSTCALTAAGAAYCWGYNGNGQLGNGGTTNATQPTAVSGGLVFASISAGGNHACGVTTASGTAAIDRQVYCWGYGQYGQLGTDALIAQNQLNVPTLVLGGNTWSAISAGGIHTCGISTNGGNIVRCWGYNQYGQIGDNTTGTNRLVPTAVAGSTTSWTRVTTGYYFSCGTNATGTYCWGCNGNGELGVDDTNSPFIIPTTVSGGLSFLSISAGPSHACGRTASALYCWGSNSSGRLGSVGVGQIKRTPTLVVQ